MIDKGTTPVFVVVSSPAETVGECAMKFVFVVGVSRDDLECDHIAERTQ